MQLQNGLGGVPRTRDFNGSTRCPLRSLMLQPHNILVCSKTGALKIADFGLARTVAPGKPLLTHEVVTLWYRPPEGEEPHGRRG